MSDRVVALLRTAVPAAWGSLVAWLLGVVAAWLPVEVFDALAGALQSDAVSGLVVVAAIALWYWVWRRVERFIPDWLIRIVLGSAKSPSYSGDEPEGPDVAPREPTRPINA